VANGLTGLQQDITWITIAHKLNEVRSNTTTGSANHTLEHTVITEQDKEEWVLWYKHFTVFVKSTTTTTIINLPFSL
jgi:hypothetical protein